MNDKIAVSKIEIKIGKDVLKLSLAQMQELKDVLNKTFPDEKTVYLPNLIYVDRPYYFHDPIYIDPPVRPWREWETTYGDSTIGNDITTTTFHIEASQCQDLDA